MPNAGDPPKPPFSVAMQKWAGVCLMKVRSHILRMSTSTLLHFETLTRMFSKVLCLEKLCCYHGHFLHVTVT